MKKKTVTLGGTILLVVIWAFLAGCTGTTNSGTDHTITLTQISGSPESGIVADNVIDANNQFAFDIYKKIVSEKNEDENIFLSPFSISSALALTYEGAKGNTAEEIRSVFHFPDNIETLREGYLSVNTIINEEDSKCELEVANALWAKENHPFLDDYISTARKYYSAETTNLDFINQPEVSRLTINSWVEEKTNDRIKDLIPQDMIDPMTRLVITNAIYFKGTWVLQFDEEMTFESDFTTSSGDTVKADIMTRGDEDAIFGYTETNDLQVLKMPYEHESGKELSMLVLLPKDNDLQAAENVLNAVNIREIQNSIESRQVVVRFPKFRLDTEYQLSETLKAMGMPTAFSGSADFSGMDGTTGLFISDVIHKAFVEVNEKGTEAAASSVVLIPMGDEEPPGPIFSANHPFIFLIQDDETGNILFIGRISNPPET